MDFGSWLLQMRLERHMDLRAFAELIGVNMSTISRIENTRIQVTLATAVRICERLGISLTTLLQALQVNSLPDLEPQHVPVHDGLLFIGDLLAFLEYMRQDWQGGCTVLAEMLAAIATRQMKSRTLPPGENAHLFVPEDVNKLLIEMPLYRFELQYPQAIEAADIWDIYRKGGWLTYLDIGVYIKKVRRGKHVPLIRLQHSTKVSDSVISRLEDGSLERIKLVDALMLDTQLEQEGKILALYWKASHFHEALLHYLIQSAQHPKDISSSLWKEQQIHISVILTILCRWLQIGSHDERSLIDELRRRLERTIPLVNTAGMIGQTSV